MSKDLTPFDKQIYNVMLLAMNDWAKSDLGNATLRCTALPERPTKKQAMVFLQITDTRTFKNHVNKGTIKLYEFAEGEQRCKRSELMDSWMQLNHV